MAIRWTAELFEVHWGTALHRGYRDGLAIIFDGPLDSASEIIQRVELFLKHFHDEGAKVTYCTDSRNRRSPLNRYGITWICGFPDDPLQLYG